MSFTIKGVTFSAGDLVQIKAATDINLTNIHSQQMNSLGYVLAAQKDAGKTVTILRTLDSYGYLEIKGEPGLNVVYLDPNWVDKIYTGVVKNPALQPTQSALQPILYNKGDIVKIKSNIDVSKSYSDYYQTTGGGAYLALRLKNLGGAIATLLSDTPNNTYKDVSLIINGVKYFADNFWVEPYIVSQTTILSPKPERTLNVPVKETVVLTPKNYSWCDACGGQSFHKLGCPPKSLIRSKAF